MSRSVMFFMLGLCACTVQTSENLTGCWIEVLPQDMPYIQGMNLMKNGVAESVGMQTLKYRSWKLEGNSLVLEGESIGNGQTIRFMDTLNIMNLGRDTLKMERRGRQVVFVRQQEPLSAVTGNGSPSRSAYEGFEWTELVGAGLKLMVQRNEDIRLIADPSLPGIALVRNGDAAPHEIIRVFDLKNNDINDVIGILEKDEGWDKRQTCMFREIDSGRTGIRRYIMVPKGEYADEMDSVMQKEPVPVTCNGWGVGNSGTRYFEIHEKHPDKAVFLNIGQDAPLFDENSIELTDEPDSVMSTDILYTLRGVLRIGHEVFSFVPEGSDEDFWIIDKTGCLNERYDQLTKGMKNGLPVDAVLRLEYNGKWDDGFASDYDGVYFVREIMDLKKR